MKKILKVILLCCIVVVGISTAFGFATKSSKFNEDVYAWYSDPTHLNFVDNNNITTEENRLHAIDSHTYNTSGGTGFTAIEFGQLAGKSDVTIFRSN